MLLTNADPKLSPAERAAFEKGERQDAVIQGAIAKARELGPGSNASPSAVGTPVRVTNAQMADQEAFSKFSRPSLAPQYRFDREKRVLASKVYTGAEYDALMAGHYCVHCDDAQVDAIPLRSEIHVPGWDEARCQPIRGGGCGQVRRKFGFRVTSIN